MSAIEPQRSMQQCYRYVLLAWTRCGLLLTLVGVANGGAGYFPADPMQIANQFYANKQKTISATIVDSAGNRIPTTRLQKGFGVALGPERISEGNWSNYMREVRYWFNSVVPENLVKWNIWEPSPGDFPKRAAFEETYITLVKEGMRLRFHPVEWYSGWPRHWSQSLPCDQYVTALYNRISTMLSWYGDKIWAWDVFNEMAYNTGRVQECNLWKTAFPRAFNMIAEAYPNSIRCLNEMVLLQSDWPEDYADKYITILRNLIRDGGAVNCAGLQAHFRPDNYDASIVWRRINKIAQYVDHIIITEYSLGENVEQNLWAEVTTNFIELVLSHPKVIQVDMWTFWDGAIYRPAGGFIRMDWSWKPGAFAIRDMLDNMLSTTASYVPPNGNGDFSWWGYPGTYEVQLLLDGQFKNAWCSLWPNGKCTIV